MFTFPCESDDIATWLNPDDSSQVWSQLAGAYVNRSDFPNLFDCVYYPASIGEMYEFQWPVPDETRDYTFLIWKNTASGFGDLNYSIVTIGPEVTKADLVSIKTAPVAVDTGTAGTVSFVSGAYVATSGATVNANLVQVNGENVRDDGNGGAEISTTQYDAILAAVEAGGSDITINDQTVVIQ